MNKPLRIFYALGPGNVVMSYRHWRAGERVPSETALTYSGQFFEFCRRSGHRGYAVSSFGVPERIVDETMIVENRPKRFVGVGFWYHLSQIHYGLSIVRSAIRWRADAAIVDNGTTHWALLCVLRFAGIVVIGNLHNTVWPAGFKPRTPMRRIVLATEAWFWRRIASAVMSVSPECERQICELAGKEMPLSVRYLGQFEPADFRQVLPPSHRLPFRVMFAGRLERNKGVFDIVEMARILESEIPGAVHFDICGNGPALDELAAVIRKQGLSNTVQLHGRLNRPTLLSIYASSHVVVVPTRSDFCEGFALVCAEAILCGRPVITSPLVPAAEVLSGATLIAKTNDARSYAESIKVLVGDEELYKRLCNASLPLQMQFYDGVYAHRSALEKVFMNLFAANRGIRELPSPGPD